MSIKQQKLDTTKARLARAIKLLGWTLLRIRARLHPAGKRYNDRILCGRCSKKIHCADAVPAGNGHVCQTCDEALQKDLEALDRLMEPEREAFLAMRQYKKDGS
jgi:hypothetical protein